MYVVYSFPWNGNIFTIGKFYLPKMSLGYGVDESGVDK